MSVSSVASGVLTTVQPLSAASKMAVVPIVTSVIGSHDQFTKGSPARSNRQD